LGLSARGSSSLEAAFEISAGQVRTRLGPAPAPDLVLSGSPRLTLGLLLAYLTPGQAQDLGLDITGDIGALRRIQPVNAPPRPAAAAISPISSRGEHASTSEPGIREGPLGKPGQDS
jgi:hypothetical protein